MWQSGARMPLCAQLLQQLQGLRVRRISSEILDSAILIEYSEFKQMLSHVNNLQQQVDNLYSNLSNLRTQVDAKADIQALPAPQPQYSRSLPLPIANGPGYPAIPTPPKPVLPKFHGVTSSAFGLNVAQSSLRNLGINPPEEHGEGMTAMEGSPGPSPPLPPLSVPRRESLHMTKDPIWSIDRDEARRLLHIYEEEMGCMYPVVSLEKMEKHIDMLYNFMDATARSGLVQVGQPGADAFNDDQTRTLKLIMASALIAEGSGNSELGRRLFDVVRPSLEEQLFSAPDIKQITMLAIAVSVEPSSPVSRHRPWVLALHFPRWVPILDLRSF